MEWEEIKNKIENALKNDRIIGSDYSSEYFNIANCNVKINDLVCFRNVYCIHEINGTLWINNNSMNVNDVETFHIWSNI